MPNKHRVVLTVVIDLLSPLSETDAKTIKASNFSFNDEGGIETEFVDEIIINRRIVEAKYVSTLPVSLQEDKIYQDVLEERMSNLEEVPDSNDVIEDKTTSEETSLLSSPSSSVFL